MSTWGNDSRLKLTEEAVAAFEQANPGITVQVENSEFSSYWDKLATQTAGNDAPDVIQMDESYIAAYGGRSALLDLGTQSSVLDLSAMDAKVLDTGKVGGTLGRCACRRRALLRRGQSGAAAKGRPEDAGRQDVDLGRPRHHGLDRHREARLRGCRRDGLLRPKRRGDRCLGTPAQPRGVPDSRARPQSPRRHW